MKYLIIGSSGLMGSTFMDLVPDSIGIDENTLDITKNQDVEKYFEKNKDKFDIVINFAAYTNVDGAEKQTGDKNGIVWLLNVLGPQNLANACKRYDKFLIHISTDFIFKGTEDYPGPYKEDAKLPNDMEGMGWYGFTKLEGEKKVRKVNPDSSVVRTAYPFRKKPYELKKDYAHGILDLFDEGKLFPLFDDQILTPILLEDLVEALQRISQIKKGGIYHVVSSNTATPFEFGCYLIKKARGKENVVQKGSMKEFLKAEGRTPRPRLGGLDTRETQRKLNMTFKTWEEMADEFAEKNKA